MESATPNGGEFDIYLDVNVSVVVNVEAEDDAAVVFHEMEEYMEREGEFLFLHRRVLYGRSGASHASYQVNAVVSLIYVGQDAASHCYATISCEQNCCGAVPITAN